MKKLEAIIRPEKLEDLKDTLSKAGFAKGMTVSQVLGYGNQKGFAEYVRGQKIVPTLLAKVKVEMIVHDMDTEEIADLICKTVRTGEVGDGKIFKNCVERQELKPFTAPKSFNIKKADCTADFRLKHTCFFHFLPD